MTGKPPVVDAPDEIWDGLSLDSDEVGDVVASVPLPSEISVGEFDLDGSNGGVPELGG